LQNVTLVIPTHGRVGRQITLQALPVALQSEAILVASLPEEAKALRSLYPDNELLVARGVKSIAEKRHWIMQNVKGHMVFMMDDDLAFFQRCPPRWRVWEEERGAYALKPGAPAGSALMTRLYPQDAALLRLFQDLDKRMTTHDPAMLGIAHRRHSDKQKESWAVNGRMMYAFGVNPDVYKRLKVKFTAVALREDFHVVLSILRAGGQGHSYVELLNNEYGSFGAAGGCSAERSMEFSDAQCFVLQKLHPQFVKVVDRAYKGSIPRKEVVVSWKKAYQSSKEK
jgi:hypothetical protein